MEEVEDEDREEAAQDDREDGGMRKSVSQSLEGMGRADGGCEQSSEGQRSGRICENVKVADVDRRA